jgi:hypothetical protein
MCSLRDKAQRDSIRRIPTWGRWNTAILTFKVVPVETCCMCGIRYVGGTAAQGMDRTSAGPKRDLAKRERRHLAGTSFGKPEHPVA